MTDPVKHPARFSVALFPHFYRIVEDFVANRYTLSPKTKILDPFAGTGRIHELEDLDELVYTFGIEIEPEWAACDPRTMQGDATRLPWEAQTFDLVITSPTYGNRFADKHQARDGSTRRGYTHDLRAMTGDELRVLAATNTGGFHFGSKQYEALHRLAWAEVWRVLKRKGRFVLNVKNFPRNGKIVNVCQWHVDLLAADLGFDLLEEIQVPTPGLRYGENRERVDHEMIYVFEKS